MTGNTAAVLAGGAAVAASILYIINLIRSRSKAESIQGKVVLLTGASSGLGEACAHEFYKAGAKLILCARRLNELERVKRNLLKLNVKESFEPKIIQLDLVEYNLMALKIEEALSCHGHIDILINNGGVSYRGEVEMTGLDVDQRLMDVNYFGQVALTKAVLPFMIGRKKGHIVAVSSVQGQIAIPYRSSYAASKHALQAFCDSLRAEVCEHNIHVSVISPAYIKTNLSLNAMTGDGSVYGAMDKTTANGMEPQTAAKKILQAVIYKSEELTIAPLLYRLVVIVRYLLPSLYFRIMNSRAKKQRSEIQKKR